MGVVPTKEGEMPREMVGNVEAGSVVKVGWDRYGGVQLGVELTDGAKVFIQPATKKVGEEALTPSLWTHDLSRKDCNDLIRTIRRARDQAHGKDE
jgi:hypothetical protein